MKIMVSEGFHISMVYLFNYKLILSGDKNSPVVTKSPMVIDNEYGKIS
jgi:hypothetical protein